MRQVRQLISTQQKTKRKAIENPANQQIGENLRIYRKSRGMTLQQMSIALDLTYQQLQKYESGQNRLKMDTVIDMAACFDIEPLDMFSILLGSGEDIDNVKTLLSEEALELVNLYESISDKKIRKQLATLIKGISGN